MYRQLQCKHHLTSDVAPQSKSNRDVDSVEVDVVIVNTAGQLVSIEVKVSATGEVGKLRGLCKLSN